MFNFIRNGRSIIRLCDLLQSNASKSIIAPTKNTFALQKLNSHVLKNFTRFCSTAEGEGEKDESPLSEEDIKKLTNGDIDLEKKLRIILLEAEVMRQDGHTVPSSSFLKFHHYQEILKMETRSARKRYWMFLFKVEKKKENEAVKKEKKKVEREEYFAQRSDTPPEDGVMEYGLSRNTILLRIHDTTINQLYNNRLMQAMQYGQKLVIDCGYDSKMTNRENINCAKQLMLVFAENRMHDEPFDLHYCNSNPESSLIRALHRHIPTMYEKWFPFNIHTSSYLNLFPKEKLVYLTPHCREEILEYDHDAIYIIGGIVDKINNEPLSLAKAKEEGLRMQKLPLDRYLEWGSGSGKSLTLNQVVSILLDVKKTGDWKHALRHVPRRKLYTDRNLGSAIKSHNSLSYDVESHYRKPRQGKIPLVEVNSIPRKWSPKKDKEEGHEEKKRLVKIKKILEE